MGELEGVPKGPKIEDSLEEVEGALERVIKKNEMPSVQLSDVVSESSYSRQTVHDRLKELAEDDSTAVMSGESGGRTIYWSKDLIQFKIPLHSTATASPIGWAGTRVIPPIVIALVLLGEFYIPGPSFLITVLVHIVAIAALIWSGNELRKAVKLYCAQSSAGSETIAPELGT